MSLDGLDITSDTGPFTVIPEWVLLSEVSHGAVRLYGLLGRYADYETGVAFPSRRTLAARLKVSPDTVDRWVKELVSVSALSVSRRLDPTSGDAPRNLTNLYTVHRSQAPLPHGGGMDAPRGSRTDAGTGGGKSATGTRTIEQEPMEPNNQVQRVFDAWLDSTGKDRARTKLDRKRRQLIEKAIASYPVEDVLDAVKGWAFSAFHRGENKDRKVYNDLALLLRDSSKIESFRDLTRGGRRLSAPETWERLRAWDDAEDSMNILGGRV